MWDGKLGTERWGQKGGEVRSGTAGGEENKILAASRLCVEVRGVLRGRVGSYTGGGMYDSFRDVKHLN